MTVESDVTAIFELMLDKGASELTARKAAIALYWQLVPDSDEPTMRHVVSLAMAAVRVRRSASNDTGPGRGPRKENLPPDRL